MASGAVPALALRAAAAVVLPNALLGRWSLGLARRWPWPERGAAGVARAVLASLAITAAATVSWVLVAGVDERITFGAWRFPTRQILLWQTVIDGLVQLALVGAGYAWHNGTRAREAQERAQRAEALRARAELQLLRTQLNPHFLLNTLHALLGLVRRNPSTAEAAIERLGELLRFGMSVEQRKVDSVSFREESEESGSLALPFMTVAAGSAGPVRRWATSAIEGNRVKGYHSTGWVSLRPDYTVVPAESADPDLTLQLWAVGTANEQALLRRSDRAVRRTGQHLRRQRLAPGPGNEMELAHG